MAILNIPRYEIYRTDYQNPEIETEAKRLLGSPDSEYNLETRIGKFLISSDYTKFLKREETVTKSPLSILNLGVTAPVQVSPAQRTRAIITKAKQYIAEAKSLAESRLEKFVPKGMPYNLTTLKKWQKLTDFKTVLANELYSQQRNTTLKDGSKAVTVYDIDKNIITPTNVWNDREYFIVKIL